MHAYNSAKVVNIYASIESDIGFFRVYSSGIVLYWSDLNEEWVHYHHWEESYDDVKQLGIKVLNQ